MNQGTFGIWHNPNTARFGMHIRIAKLASLPYIGHSSRAWLNSFWTSHRIWQVETNIMEKCLPSKVPSSLLILYNIEAIYKL
jgi:hypothetical protein